MKNLAFWLFVGLGVGTFLWELCGCKVSSIPPSPSPQGIAVSKTPEDFHLWGKPSFYYQRFRLPGDKAPGFELKAVVGDEIKKIKLSDYKGKWLVLFFYPADFTFV